MRNPRSKPGKKGESMKHTPGPWKAAEAICENAPNEHIVTNGKWGAANIAIVDTEANARLIAQAPAMLDALKSILDMGWLPKDAADVTEALIAEAER